MKKLLLFALLICSISGMNAATKKIIAYWNFNSSTPDAKTSTGSLSPDKGKGMVIPYGSVTNTFATGFGKDPDSSKGDNSGANFTSFPDSATGSKTAGAGFKVSSKGLKNISMFWAQRHSNTCSKYAALQYSTDGNTWKDYTGTGTDTADVYRAKKGDNFYVRNADFTGLGLDDKDSIFIRVVSVFKPGASKYFPTTANAKPYATTGTWRFDVVTISGDTIGGTTTPQAPRKFSLVSPGDKGKIRADSNSKKTIVLKWTKSKRAGIYNVNLYSPLASTTALTSFPSDNNGKDTILTLISGDVFSLVVQAGLNQGDSTDFLWDVTATDTNNSATTSSTEKWTVNVRRSKYNGIENFGASMKSFTVYPNPAFETLYINNLKTGSSVSILDASGRVVVSQQVVNSNVYTLPLTIPTGLYFVRVSNGSVIETHKFIVK